MKWQTCIWALAATVLLMSPACGQTGTPGGAGNQRDQRATERAGHQTNDTAADSAGVSREPTIRPDASAGRADRPTGTSGTALRPTEEAMGLGPDAAITMRVQARYADDDVVKGRRIDVDTADGVVTLNGSVDSAAEKQAAERLASQVDGVKRVVNRLAIARP